jgi:Mrp family chromosome partitioning ATPase
MTFIERAVQASRSAAAGGAAGAEDGAPPRDSAARRALPVSGEPISFGKLAAQNALVLESTDRNIYEQFRRLKRPLLQCAFGPLAESNCQVVMITSPLQGAGKTFVASNLAHVLALEKDRSVLLVDCDSANPSLSRHLGLLDRPGLFDVINESGPTLEQAVCRTEYPGLYVLPAGQSAGDSLERLTSDRCRNSFKQILARNPGGIVILDAPPLLMTNEALSIAALAGQYVLVVEAGGTANSNIQKALELLDHQKPIGLVLNRTVGQGEVGYYYAYASASGTGTGS